ncbi:MAG: MarR family transcriptional regulator [Lutibacter sp.]|jgi:DNA-binding MarR family transcriptional regulator|nr:MarR family transcriptional regulator [Lutibacter sp.]MDO9594790.1 MarR family transcriptional regulator [Lutibacter sp.]
MGDISKDINSKFPNERTKALINIKFTANWLNTVGNEFLNPFKITNQQYNILRILKGANDAVTVNTVKERMIEKSPNATRLMDKLCDKGLLERTRCENDRRVVYVKISEKGLKLLDKINIDELGNPMNTISEEEAKTLNEILDKIR